MKNEDITMTERLLLTFEQRTHLDPITAFSWGYIVVFYDPRIKTSRINKQNN